MKSDEFKRLLALAKQADNLGYSASAAELYKLVVHHAPKRDSAHYRAAINLTEAGRLSDAENHLNSLRRNAAPKPWLIEFQMGNLRTAQFRIKEAETHFRAARRMNPGSTAPSVLLADCLLSQEKFDEAEAILLEALSAEGDIDEVFLNLGAVARAKRDYKAAHDYLTKALEIAPDKETRKTAQHGLNDVNFLLGILGR